LKRPGARPGDKRDGAGMARILQTLGAWLALASSAGLVLADEKAETRARNDYLLHCSGCHGQDGMGKPGKGIPRFEGQIGYFQRLPEVKVRRVPSVVRPDGVRHGRDGLVKYGMSGSRDGQHSVAQVKADMSRKWPSGIATSCKSGLVGGHSVLNIRCCLRLFLSVSRLLNFGVHHNVPRLKSVEKQQFSDALSMAPSSVKHFY